MKPKDIMDKITIATDIDKHCTGIDSTMFNAQVKFISQSSIPTHYLWENDRWVNDMKEKLRLEIFHELYGEVIKQLREMSPMILSNDRNDTIRPKLEKLLEDLSP